MSTNRPTVPSIDFGDRRYQCSLFLRIYWNLMPRSQATPMREQFWVPSNKSADPNLANWNATSKKFHELGQHSMVSRWLTTVISKPEIHRWRTSCVWRMLLTTRLRRFGWPVVCGLWVHFGWSEAWTACSPDFLQVTRDVYPFIHEQWSKLIYVLNSIREIIFFSLSSILQ